MAAGLGSLNQSAASKARTEMSEREVVIKLRIEGDKSNAKGFEAVAKGAETAQQQAQKSYDKITKDAEKSAKAQEREWARANREMLQHDLKRFNAQSKIIADRQKAEEKAAKEAEKTARSQAREAEKIARDRQRAMEQETRSQQQEQHKRESAERAAAASVVTARNAMIEKGKMAMSGVAQLVRATVLLTAANEEDARAMMEQIAKAQAFADILRGTIDLLHGATSAVRAYRTAKTAAMAVEAAGGMASGAAGAAGAAGAGAGFLAGGLGAIGLAGGFAALGVGAAAYSIYDATHEQKIPNWMMNTAASAHNGGGFGSLAVLPYDIRNGGAVSALADSQKRLGKTEDNARVMKSRYDYEEMRGRLMGEADVLRNQHAAEWKTARDAVLPRTPSEVSADRQKVEGRYRGVVSQRKALEDRQREYGLDEKGAGELVKLKVLEADLVGRVRDAYNAEANAAKEANATKIAGARAAAESYRAERQAHLELARSFREAAETGAEKFGKLDAGTQSRLVQIKRKLNNGGSLTAEEAALLDRNSGMSESADSARSQFYRDRGNKAGYGEFGGDEYKRKAADEERQAKDIKVQIQRHATYAVRLEADAEKMARSIHDEIGRLEGGAMQKVNEMLAQLFMQGMQKMFIEAVKAELKTDRTSDTREGPDDLARDTAAKTALLF